VAKTKGISSFDQIPSEAFLQMDLRFCADLVENTFGDKLADPPKGVYHVGQLQPVMADGNSYFYREGTEMLLVEDLNKISVAIFDINGKCVVPARYMRDKARFLSNAPMLPYRGLQIIKGLVNLQINNFVAYRRSSGKDAYDVLAQHLRPTEPAYEPGLGEETLEQREDRLAGITNQQDELVQLLDTCYSEIRNDLKEFLGSKYWNIYFTKLHATTLRVERCMDWRAWEWEQKHGDAFRAGKYA
jgi:hypothetical protein